jgi:hypothetical protein
MGRFTFAVRFPRGARPLTTEIVRALVALGTVALWGGVFLLLVGCNSWDGRAEVRLQDGTVLHCDGLSFTSHHAICLRRNGSVLVAWKEVGGYATGSHLR